MQGLGTPHELSFTNRRHVSVAQLEAAIKDLVNAHHRCDLQKVWGTGSSAAADRTKYELAENSLLAEYSIRYGGYGGIAYHHVSDTYVALFSHFIPCGVWEAIYILEGLLKNTSDIQPTTVHADTQCQSTPVHALSFLLGIKLMPRIRNWKSDILSPEQRRQVSAHRRPVQRHRRLAADPGSLARPAAGSALDQGWHDLIRTTVATAGVV
jgi:TnpA family transposase